MLYGYGQLKPGQAAAQVAMQACAAMGGQWDPTAMECKTMAGDTYKLPDFEQASLPPGGCPEGQVQTPKGCFPYPGGVEDGGPNGAPNGVPVPQPGPAPAPTEPQLPSWVLPAVVGIGAVALIALVVK